MGTVNTPLLSLPAPDGADDYRNGDDQARALAQAVEDSHAVACQCSVSTGSVATDITNTNKPWTSLVEEGGWTLANSDHNLIVPTSAVYLIALTLLAASHNDTAAVIGRNDDPATGVEVPFMSVDSQESLLSAAHMSQVYVAALTAGDYLRTAVKRAASTGTVTVGLRVVRLF